MEQNKHSRTSHTTRLSRGSISTLSQLIVNDFQQQSRWIKDCKLFGEIPFPEFNHVDQMIWEYLKLWEKYRFEESRVSIWRRPQICMSPEARPIKCVSCYSHNRMSVAVGMKVKMHLEGRLNEPQRDQMFITLGISRRRAWLYGRSIAQLLPTGGDT